MLPPPFMVRETQQWSLLASYPVPYCASAKRAVLSNWPVDGGRRRGDELPRDDAAAPSPGSGDRYLYSVMLFCTACCNKMQHLCILLLQHSSRPCCNANGAQKTIVFYVSLHEQTFYKAVKCLSICVNSLLQYVIFKKQSKTNDGYKRVLLICNPIKVIEPTSNQIVISSLPIVLDQMRPN